MRTFNIITTSCYHTALERLIVGNITEKELVKEWARYEDLPIFKREGYDDAYRHPISGFVSWLREKGYDVSQLEYINVFV